LERLQSLDLYDNQLTGPIPESIGNLVLLQLLNIRNNQLTGSIPDSIGNLMLLEYLYMSNNQLSGDIPDSFGNLSVLNSLSVHDNQLAGKWPASMMHCNALLVASAANNPDFDDSQQLWKLKITDFKPQPVVSGCQVAALLVGAGLGYLDIISDCVSAVVLFSNQQHTLFWLQLFLLLFPSTYLATTTPALTLLDRLYILFNISLGIETHNSIQGKTETNMFLSLKFFEFIVEACPSIILQLHFVLSSSAALDSLGSGFVLFSVAVSAASISVTLSKMFAVVPEMQEKVSNTLCLLYHTVEVIYRLATFAAVFLALGVFGAIFAGLAVLLRLYVCFDSDSLRHSMTRALILTVTDVLMFEYRTPKIFQGSIELYFNSLDILRIIRIARHMEAFIAFILLLWHPWAGDVLLSRRLALLYTALAAAAVKEALLLDRSDVSGWRCSRLVRRAEVKAREALGPSTMSRSDTEGGGTEGGGSDNGSGDVDGTGRKELLRQQV
jgi:hypothetical protein